MRKRIVSLLLCMCMIFMWIPNIPFAEAKGSDQEIMLGTSGIEGYDGLYDYIYYGILADKPVQWRVLDDETNMGTQGLFLLSEYLLSDKGIAPNSNGDYILSFGDPDWQKSDARVWCQNFFANRFSALEQDAVILTTKSDEFFSSSDYRNDIFDPDDTQIWSGSDFMAQEYILNNDTVFFLSAEEMETARYGFGTQEQRVFPAYKDSGIVSEGYLRSRRAEAVSYPGVIDVSGGGISPDVGNAAAFPAFNLDYEKVLFSSTSIGGKARNVVGAEGLQAVSSTDSREWKLTLKDPSRNFTAFLTDANNKVVAGESVKIDYANAEIGDNEYVSAMIVDQNDKILYYGHIAQNSAEGTGQEIQIPVDLPQGQYSLKVFSEQCNGGVNDDTRITDYASDFVNISIEVQSAIPVLSAGTVDRTSDSHAQVEFTSDRPGEYYYAVVDAEAEIPVIDTSVSGIPCDATTQTIQLEDLTRGAKDIYIIVKAGNGKLSSNNFKIRIPEYRILTSDVTGCNLGWDYDGYDSSNIQMQTVTITNIKNESVVLTQPTAVNYDIGALSATTLENGQSATFTIAPKMNLPVGEYSEEIIVSGSYGNNVTNELNLLVTFTVFPQDIQREIMVGTNDISGYSDTEKYDYIYFGKELVKWRVLSDQTNMGTDNGLFLLSEYLMDERLPPHTPGRGVNFAGPWDRMHWSNNGYPTFSDNLVKEWCEDWYIAKFSAQEQELILETNKTDPQYTTSTIFNSSTATYEVDENVLKNDRIFILSAEEAENAAYGFIDKESRIATIKGEDEPQEYWLRSWIEDKDAKGGYSAEHITATVTENGTGYNNCNGYCYDMQFKNGHYFRPACNIDKSQIGLSVSATGNSKDPMGKNALQLVEENTTSEWKLMLTDSTRNFTASLSDGSNQLQAGTTVLLDYAGANRGTNEYVSALIQDSEGKVLYYGRIANNTSSDDACELLIPYGVPEGEYQLKLFSEKDPGNYKTGFVSNFVEIPIHVDEFEPEPPETDDDTSEKPELNCSITANPSVLDFGTLQEGYSATPSAQKVTINNNGNCTVSFATSEVISFNVNKPSESELAAGENAEISIQPKAGLKEGKYEEVLTIYGEYENGSVTSIEIRLKFTVSSGESDQTSGSGNTVTKYPIIVESTGDGTAVSNKKEAASGENIVITANGVVNKITVSDKAGKEISVTDNGNGSYTFKMPASEVTVSVAFVTDISGVSEWLNTKNHMAYLNGYENEEFRPDNDMTRAEAAQMFYNLLLDRNVPITVSFSDVQEDAWYAEAVNTLASLGMVLGVSENQFEPDRSITRAEFVTIAMRFANRDIQGENIFADISADDWFYEDVVGAVQYGWITGYSDDLFCPDKTITRAEVTTVVNRMLGRCADEAFVNDHQAELNRFRDVYSSYWAYYNIVEATNEHDYTRDGKKEVWII